MEPKIHRPKAHCNRTGQGFQPGDAIVSSLARAPGGLERSDCLATAWAGPPETCVAWWRSTYPQPDAGGASLAPNDVLLDILEQLEGHPDDAALRYLLSLQLVRRRVLRIVDTPADTEPATASGELHLACRKRDCEYTIPIVLPATSDAAAVEERLAGLLWSGDAA